MSIAQTWKSEYQGCTPFDGMHTPFVQLTSESGCIILCRGTNVVTAPALSPLH